jgi:hypothetical protein
MIKRLGVSAAYLFTFDDGPNNKRRKPNARR